jgi:uncharacterized protein
MKVFIVSDIHGRLLVAKRLKEIILAYDPDRILFLGDYLYNGPRNGVPSDYDPLGVCTILNEFSKKAVGVRGNCDSRVDAMLLDFPIKDNVYLHLNGYRLDLFHGDEYSAKRLRTKPGDILVSGHTHVQVLSHENGFIQLNPGSPSFPKNGNAPSFAVFEPTFIEIRSFSDLSVISRLDLFK